jgi:hypothetical protein
MPQGPGSDRPGGTGPEPPGPPKPPEPPGPTGPKFPKKVPASNKFFTPEQVAQFPAIVPASSLGQILSSFVGVPRAPQPAPLFNFGNLGGGGFRAMPAPPEIGQLLSLLEGL